MKGGHRNVVGTGKNMWGLCVCFLIRLEIKKIASKKLRQVYLKHTTVIGILTY